MTGYGSADKRQVQAMIARILRLDAPPQPADAADALALAICHLWRGATAATSTPGPTKDLLARRAATRQGAGLTRAQEQWAAALRSTRR